MPKLEEAKEEKQKRQKPDKAKVMGWLKVHGHKDADLDAKSFDDIDADICELHGIPIEELQRVRGA